MSLNFFNLKYYVLLLQQYTPRDRFLVIRNTASQGVSFAFNTFRFHTQTRYFPYF